MYLTDLEKVVFVASHQPTAMSTLLNQTFSTPRARS